jgi:hypothetical protein
MVDAPKLDSMLLEFETDSADAGNGNAASIGKGDGEVKMSDVPVGSEVMARVPQVPRSAGVDTTVIRITLI